MIILCEILLDPIQRQHWQPWELSFKPYLSFISLLRHLVQEFQLEQETIFMLTGHKGLIEHDSKHCMCSCNEFHNHLIFFTIDMCHTWGRMFTSDGQIKGIDQSLQLFFTGKALMSEVILFGLFQTTLSGPVDTISDLVYIMYITWKI